MSKRNSTRTITSFFQKKNKTESVESLPSLFKQSGDSPFTRELGAKRMKPEHGLVESTFRLSGDSPLTGELGVERMKQRKPKHGPQLKHHILKGDICFLGDPWQEAATSAGKEISWADIGIKINIPPGAISEDKLITVSVQPCLSGPFELPEDYELASPIYAISPELEFNKDVKLFMAHFADLQNEDDCKNMTFLTTQSSSLPGDSPPYKLIVQENGVFQRGSSVGELSMRHFCRKAVGRRRKQDVTPSRDQEPKLDNKDQQGGAEQSKVTLNGKPHNLYLVQLYQNTGDYPIDNIAAVTVSLHQPVYAMNFKKCLEEWYPSFHFVPSGKVVRFSSRGKASVKFPTDVQGWSIVSDIQPCEIHRVEVDFPILTPHLDYSKALTYPPKRLLTISPPPAEVGLPHSNDCPLLISGFSEKVQFTLKLRPRPYKPSMMEGSQLPKPELNDLMHLQVSDWYSLGLALKLVPYDLNIIEKDFRGDTRKQTCKMFELWLKTQPDASHEQLVKALHKVGDERVANFLCKKYAKCSLESFSKDDSKECIPSHSSERPMECLSSSTSQWKHSSSSDSRKRHHVSRDRHSRLRSPSPRHSSSSKHQSHSPKSHRRQLYSQSPLHSRSPTSISTSHSHSSKRRTESRSHKQKSKSSSSRRSRAQSPPRRRSRARSPPRRRSRSRSPRHSSSNRHQSRPHSPRSRRHRRQSHSTSPRQRSHSGSPISRSIFHSHSPKRRRSKSRSLSPHKQRVKSNSTRRRSRSQSPSKKRLSSHSPKCSSSSRHRSRSQSPKSHRRDRSQSHSWSPRQRSHSRFPTSRSTFHSHRSKRRKSKSRSQSPPRKRWSMRSHSPGYSSNGRHRSRSHSPRSRRRRHFESPHRRSRSRFRTPRNSSCSQRPKRRSKSRSRSPHNC